MKELSLLEIHEIELQLLKKFHNICQEQGFRYSLCAGSLLGAVRHKGFIPWDDDIDVIMPRPDYDRFIRYCKEQAVPFGLVTYDTVEGFNGLIAKLWDESTVIKERVAFLDFPIGVHLEVFPAEGLGNTKKEALKIFRSTTWKRELLNAAQWKKYSRSKTHGLLTEPIRFILFVISRFVNPKRLVTEIDQFSRSHLFEDSTFAGVVSGSYREREILPRKVFEEYTEADFEGEKFKIFRNYDAYLSSIYGDYMKLPPEEKRVAHHTFQAYLK